MAPRRKHLTELGIRNFINEIGKIDVCENSDISDFEVRKSFIHFRSIKGCEIAEIL